MDAVLVKIFFSDLTKTPCCLNAPMTQTPQGALTIGSTLAG